METVGNYLKNIRLSRSISIEEVSRNTNIPRKYIENIENNNFSEFPGEVYLKGFIKSYANFLGVDPDFAVNLYEKTTLEEKDIPIEALLPKKGGTLSKISDFFRTSTSRVFFISLLSIIFVSFFVLIIVLLLTRSSYKVLLDNRNATIIYKNLSGGESFKYKSEKGELILKVIEIKNSGNDIILSINDKIFSVGLKQEITLDIDGDGVLDLKVRYENITGGNVGLKISFYKVQKSQEKQNIILIDGASIPVNMVLASSKLVWVSIQIDNNTNEVQFYMNKGETRSFQASSRFVLKTSDIKSLSLFCDTNQLQLNGEGVSYTVIEISPSMKGVSLKIKELD